MNLKEFTGKYGNKEVEEAKLKELLGIKDSKVWKPEYGEVYWCVDSIGIVCKGIWTGKNFDSYRYDIGNCYKTEEEAEFQRDKQQFLLQMERDFLDNSDEIDWGDEDQEKYFFYINHESGDIFTTYYYVFQQQGYHTTNKEWLKQYIKDNEADIKKYYFNIK